jgi:nicotinamidase-related amidase
MEECITNTPYEAIIDVGSIGSPMNPIDQLELLRLAGNEKIRPAAKDTGKRVAFLGIDFQNSFMETRSLGVPGSYGDIARVTDFLYRNLEDITEINVSFDTHPIFAIFFEDWWKGPTGEHPKPFTVIGTDDINAGTWTPILEPVLSKEYVEALDQQGQFKLCIWPYHCINGSYGHALEGQLANLVQFHARAKRSQFYPMTKGTDPLTERYGILKSEYDPSGAIELEFLNKLAQFDKIFIAGEAKSHCVRRTIEQLVDYFKNQPEFLRKIVILEDCMSSIPGYEDATEKAFEGFKNDYQIGIERSTDLYVKDVI